MLAHADRPPGSPRVAADVDLVSEVMRAVHLHGAVYFAFTGSAPWAAESPPARELAGHMMGGAEHVIPYHVVVSGTCWGGLPGEPGQRLEPGDVILFPQGDAHVMASGPGMRGPRELPHHARALHERLPIRVECVHGHADAAPARLVCGFLACDASPLNPLLAALPRVLVSRPAERGGEGLVELLVERALAESRTPRTGGDVVLARMSELMFAEVVRCHLATLAPSQVGWLAGLRDPIVGRALAALHARPAADWSLDALARHVGASRSALAQRFTQLVGQPPMQYLTQWRMQLAATRLARGDTLAAIAAEVGYGSEAALSRAFKKVVGVAPAGWRAQRANAAA